MYSRHNTVKDINFLLRINPLTKLLENTPISHTSLLTARLSAVIFFHTNRSGGVPGIQSSNATHISKRHTSTASPAQAYGQHLRVNLETADREFSSSILHTHTIRNLELLDASLLLYFGHPMLLILYL